ncbi:hypothetical protein QUF56_13110 [Ureibacillus composti]|nr:hypothetical protein [Ureibacillus composti]
MSISFSEMVFLIIFIGGPLLVPILTKKWIWFITMVVGYSLYIMWGVFLHFTSDITEYGTGYGMFIIPYLIGVTIIGVIIQRIKSKASNER